MNTNPIAITADRQAGQITPGIPGALARGCSTVLTMVLPGAGDLAEAERADAAVLARTRDTGDLRNQALLLPRIAELDLRAGRTGDAAAHLREGSRSRCGPATASSCNSAYPSAATSAPRPAAPPRP